MDLLDATPPIRRVSRGGLLRTPESRLPPDTARPFLKRSPSLPECRGFTDEEISASERRSPFPTNPVPIPTASRSRSGSGTLQRDSQGRFVKNRNRLKAERTVASVGAATPPVIETPLSDSLVWDGLEEDLQGPGSPGSGWSNTLHQDVSVILSDEFVDPTTEVAAN